MAFRIVNRLSLFCISLRSRQRRFLPRILADRAPQPEEAREDSQSADDERGQLGKQESSHLRPHLNSTATDASREATGPATRPAMA